MATNAADDTPVVLSDLGVQPGPERELLEAFHGLYPDNSHVDGDQVLEITLTTYGLQTTRSRSGDPGPFWYTGDFTRCLTDGNAGRAAVVIAPTVAEAQSMFARLSVEASRAAPYGEPGVVKDGLLGTDNGARYVFSHLTKTHPLAAPRIGDEDVAILVLAEESHDFEGNHPDRYESHAIGRYVSKTGTAILIIQHVENAEVVEPTQRGLHGLAADDAPSQRVGLCTIQVAEALSSSL